MTLFECFSSRWVLQEKVVHWRYSWVIAHVTWLYKMASWWQWPPSEQLAFEIGNYTTRHEIVHHGKILLTNFCCFSLKVLFIASKRGEKTFWLQSIQSATLPAVPSSWLQPVSGIGQPFFFFHSKYSNGFAFEFYVHTYVHTMQTPVNQK